MTDVITPEIRARMDAAAARLRERYAADDALREQANRAFDASFRRALAGKLRGRGAERRRRAMSLRIAALVCELGGVEISPRVYTLRTVDGPLRVSVYDSWVACRFEGADVVTAARSRVGCNPYSGKFNFHPDEPPASGFDAWLDGVVVDLLGHLVRAVGDVELLRAQAIRSS